MSGLTDQKIILIIDGDDRIANALYKNDQRHDIIHKKTFLEGDLIGAANEFNCPIRCW
jgi:hypothetical protein